MRPSNAAIPLIALMAFAALASLPAPAHGQAPGVAVTQVFWGLGETRLQPQAGDKNVPLTVKLVVLAEEGINSLLATLQLDDVPFTSAVGGKEAFAGVTGPIAFGGAATLVFWLDIDSQAQPAVYSVRLNLEVKSPRFLTAVKTTETIPLAFHGKVELAARLEPPTIKPGINTVELIVENRGQAEALDVKAKLTPPAALTLLGDGGDLTLGSLKPRSLASTRLQIFAPTSAVGSSTPIALTLEFLDPYGVSRTEIGSLGLAVGNGTVSIGAVEVTRISWGSEGADLGVRPGDSNAKLFITIRNLSNQTLVGVSGKLLLKPPFSGPGSGEATSTVSRIGPGQTGVLSYTLDVGPEAEPGVYALPLQLSYLVKNDLSAPVSYIEAPGRVLTVPLAVEGEPIVSVRARVRELVTGRVSEFPIVIENLGTAPITRLDVRLDLPTVSAQAQPAAPDLRAPIVNMEGDNFWRFDSLGPKSSVTIRPRLLPAEGSAGSYELALTLTYREASGVVKTERRTLGVRVLAEVVEPVIGVSSFRLSPSSVVQGQTFTATFTLVNLGREAAQNVRVEAVAPQSLALLNLNSRILGTLNPGQEKAVTYRLQASPSAPGGSSQPLRLKVTYADAEGVEQVSQFSVGIPVEARVSRLTISRLEVSGGEVFQGQTFTLSFTVENVGNEKAKAVSARISTPQPIGVLSSSLQVLGDLEPGERRTAAYRLRVSPTAQPGSFQTVKLDLSFVDEVGRERATGASLTVPVHGKVELVLMDGAVRPPLLEAGSPFTVTFTLINTGTASTFFTNVSLSPSPLLRLSPGSASYIGQLDPDAPVPAELTAEVAPGAPEGQHAVEVKVSYKDEFQKRHERTFPFTVRIVSSQPVSPAAQAATGSKLNAPTPPGILPSQPLIAAALAAAAASALLTYKRKTRRGGKPPAEPDGGQRAAPRPGRSGREGGEAEYKAR